MEQPPPFSGDTPIAKQQIGFAGSSKPSEFASFGALWETQQLGAFSLTRAADQETIRHSVKDWYCQESHKATDPTLSDRGLC